jgi:hypothetical protein
MKIKINKLYYKWDLIRYQIMVFICRQDKYFKKLLKMPNKIFRKNIDFIYKSIINILIYNFTNKLII